MSLVCTANRYTKVDILPLYSDVMQLTTGVVGYWSLLEHCNLLKYRLADCKNPKMRDILEMYGLSTNRCSLMWDHRDERFCADTMINNFKGLTAQVHFSIHPSYKGAEGIEIARAGCEQHFQLVNKEGHNLSTLIGLTPETNRLALRFIKRVGFKVLDIIENLYYNYETEKYVGGVLTKLTSEGLYNG